MIKLNFEKERNMNIDFSVKEAVIKRYSVRNYSQREIESQKISLLKKFIESLDNPFGGKVNFHFLDNVTLEKPEKLGTYGVIKGARSYIGATIKLEEMSLEALGYEFEAMVLFLANLDIGTCWLGGTFDRQGFSEAMNVGSDEVFPIITPYGYAADDKHEKEIEMRKLIQADHRKDWSQLFFDGDFNTALTEERAGDVAFSLEMVRLGPSASNKQPWRIVMKEGEFHFYEYKEPGYSDYFSYDIQRVDMGIAAAHFDFAVKEKGIKGSFKTVTGMEKDLPENMNYVFSWVKEK